METKLGGAYLNEGHPILSALDLFCGCGGMTEGLKRVGFNVLGGVDIDPVALRVYKANHPEVRTWETDIRDLNPNELFNSLNLRPGRLGLLAGCPPCQGFSAMRTLNGARHVEDPRNTLLSEFERFIEAMLPMSVMLENVPGLEKDKSFSFFLRKLEKLGYVGKHTVLNAADYGVPQRRRRLIYLGGRGESIPFSDKLSGSRKTVRETIEKMAQAGKSGDVLHDLPEKRTSKVVELIRRIPKDGGSRSDLPTELVLDCHKRCSGFKDVYGRMAWDNIAPTITSGCFNPSKGRFLHPVEDRAITLREAALLQGFPEGYKFPCEKGKAALALMIGNALPPPFIEAHGKMVRQFLIGRMKGGE